MRRRLRGLIDRATGRGRPGRAGRAEAGDTLIEVLFAVVILGIASVALMIAFAASISASAVHRSLATFDTVIRSASQQAISQIQQQPDPLYESCAPARLLPDRPGRGRVQPPVGLHGAGHERAVLDRLGLLAEREPVRPELAAVDHHHHHELVG